MQKNIKQIRNLEVIEKELNTNPTGIFAISIEDEKVIQLSTTFLYQDKNIYLFLDEASDLYQSIKLDASASFALIRNDKSKKGSKNESAYNSFSIIISGALKKVDEQKIIDDVKQSYLKKYLRGEGNTDDINGKVVMIDTEEIQANEETGD